MNGHFCFIACPDSIYHLFFSALCQVGSYKYFFDAQKGAFHIQSEGTFYYVLKINYWIYRLAATDHPPPAAGAALRGKTTTC